MISPKITYQRVAMPRTLQEIMTSEKPDVVKKAKSIAAEILLNIHLSELREKPELTQKEIATAMGIKQPLPEWKSKGKILKYLHSKNI